HDSDGLRARTELDRPDHRIGAGGAETHHQAVRLRPDLYRVRAHHIPFRHGPSRWSTCPIAGTSHGDNQAQSCNSRHETPHTHPPSGKRTQPSNNAAAGVRTMAVNSARTPGRAPVGVPASALGDIALRPAAPTGRMSGNNQGSRGIFMAYDNRQFYIDGAWVNPVEPKEFNVINPATETV